MIISWIPDLVLSCIVNVLSFLSSDSGGLFSGHSIVKWMIETLHGVNSEQDAETLGQLLLDKGGIFHSEGSRCVCGVTCV